MDFIPRLVSGRLAEVLGAGALGTDRFFRSTGLDRAARTNAAAIEAEGGDEAMLIAAFCRGVNARIDELAGHELPVEFRGDTEDSARRA